MRQLVKQTAFLLQPRVGSACPTGVPSTTIPRWADGLSPRQTSSPSSAMPGGGGPSLAAIARILPRLDPMPQWSATAWVAASSAVRARLGAVTMYKSSRKAIKVSPACRPEAARCKASCCPNAYSAGASGSPCSHPSPCLTSLCLPASSHQLYAEGRP